MSWDFDLIIQPEPTCGCGAPKKEQCPCCWKEFCLSCRKEYPSRYLDLHWNYTSNTAKMLHVAAVATGWTTEQVWIGELLSAGTTKASEFSNRMAAVFAWWEQHRDEMVAMNPTNGWGDFDSYRKALKEWVVQCDRFPDYLIYLSR